MHNNLKKNYQKTRNYVSLELKYSFTQYHNMLRDYAKHLGINESEYKNKQLFFNEVGNRCQEDWSAWMKFFISIRSNYPRVFKNIKQKKPKQNPYDEWYQESSQDGSFAYNGSAEDF